MLSNSSERKVCGCGKEYAVSRKYEHEKGIRHRYWVWRCGWYGTENYTEYAPPLPANWKPDPCTEFEISGKKP